MRIAVVLYLVAVFPSLSLGQNPAAERAIVNAIRESQRGESVWRMARDLKVTPAITEEMENEGKAYAAECKAAAQKEYNFRVASYKKYLRELRNGGPRIGRADGSGPTAPRKPKPVAKPEAIDNHPMAFTRSTPGSFVHNYHAVFTVIAIEKDGILLRAPFNGENCKVLCDPPKDIAAKDRVKTNDIFRVGERIDSVTQLHPVNFSKWVSTAAE